MKLITEYVDDLEYLSEAKKDGSKASVLQGVFMQAEEVNRNRRVYPKNVLESAVEVYVREQVNTNRAVGELNHPEGPSVNLDKVSHKITSLVFEGNNVVGRAEVLNTPMGQIVKGLLDGGVQLAVSSRGMGSVKEKSGVSYVSEGYILSTVDIVQNPSAPQAFVNGIMEGVEWVKNDDGTFEQFADDVRKRIHKTPSAQLAEAQVESWNRFMRMLQTK